MSVIVLDAALAYAARGWPVYPVKEKRPLIAEWPAAARTDPSQLEAWWAKWDAPGVAIVTGPRSGVVAIDLDDDAVGGEAYGMLLLEHGAPGSVERPDGAIIRTGRDGGGWRLLFAIPPGVTIGKGTLAPGVEYMGAGGSAIMPPSVHPTGRRYVWREDPPPQLPVLSSAWASLMVRPTRAAQLPPAPGRFNGTGTPYGLAALRDELDRLAQAEEGTRNVTLNAAAFSVGSLAAAGHLDLHSAAVGLGRVGVAIGLSPTEVEATLASGIRAGLDSPRTERSL